MVANPVAEFVSNLMAKPFQDIRQIADLSRQAFEETCTKYAKSFYMGEHLLLCKLLTKYKIYLDARDVSVTPNLLMDGYWEPWVTKFITQTVQPGDVCIDAGANFGYYSLLLSELAGKDGRVVSIEPNSYLCKLLYFTSTLNEYPFEIIPKALSNAKAEMMLSIPVNFWGSATIRKEKEDDNLRQEKVFVDTLDQIAEDLNITHIDFIKMDCEGVEPEIFEGMTKVLQYNPQLKIVMEYSPFMYKDAKAFTDFLFRRFDVGEISTDSTIKELTADDIPNLLSIPAHIDLFLKLKVIVPIDDVTVLNNSGREFGDS